MGDDIGGGTDSPNGVAPSWVVRMFASVILSCTIKTQNNHYYYNKRFTTLCPGLPRSVSTRTVSYTHLTLPTNREV